VEKQLVCEAELTAMIAEKESVGSEEI